MANITFWYKVAPGDTLGTVPAAQKILFDTKDRVIKEYKWQWGNIIKATPNVNRTGVRSVAVEDAGWDGIPITFTGWIRATETTEADNLFNFIDILQTPTALPFGRFSIDNPNGPKMTIESNATQGISISKPADITWNPTDKAYDFNFPLVYAGTFP